MATVVGPDAAALDTTLGAVDGGDATGFVVAPLVQAARIAVDKVTRADPATRCIGFLRGVSGSPIMRRDRDNVMTAR
jgi:hypothetical protein